MDKDKKAKPYDPKEKIRKMMKYGKKPKIDDMPSNKVMEKMPMTRPKKKPAKK